MNLKKNDEPSRYFRFHSKLMGWDFYLKGNKVTRWELFVRRVDAFNLLNGLTQYEKEARPTNYKIV